MSKFISDIFFHILRGLALTLPQSRTKGSPESFLISYLTLSLFYTNDFKITPVSGVRSESRFSKK